MVGREDLLEDPRFASNPKRVENRDALLPLIDELFANKTCDEWMDILVDVSIPCGPVNNMEHLFADPQVRHRNMIEEVPHPTIGTLKLVGIPIKYSDTPGTVRFHPPLLGEHTDEIVKSVLGLSDEQIAALKSNDVIVQR